MLISMIAAMANNRIIGNNNELPWHLPADLQHFKQVTLGKPIIMGRKTYDSIGRALPGRRNIILTRQNLAEPDPKCDYYHGIDDALASCEGTEEVMIIGGATIYEQCLSKADRLYLTLIDTTVEGDATFPDWQQLQWQTVAESSHTDEQSKLNYRLLTLDRRRT